LYFPIKEKGFGHALSRVVDVPFSLGCRLLPRKLKPAAFFHTTVEIVILLKKLLSPEKSSFPLK
jgi:hypothetical protein